MLEAARVGQDYVITSYRDHVHAIKCGVDPKAVMAELFSRETGCCKGLGGSMHIFGTEHRFMGGYALVGGPFPLAAGIAKGIKMKGDDDICICFLGDAANNQGTFHESLNMAKVWNLPVLYVCENNQWAQFTPEALHLPLRDLSRRAEGYGLPGVSVGNDFFEISVYPAVSADEGLEMLKQTVQG